MHESSIMLVIIQLVGAFVYFLLSNPIGNDELPWLWLIQIGFWPSNRSTILGQLTYMYPIKRLAQSHPKKLKTKTKWIRPSLPSLCSDRLLPRRQFRRMFIPAARHCVHGRSKGFLESTDKVVSSFGISMYIYMFYFSNECWKEF